jgi:hypothetical protein
MDEASISVCASSEAPVPCCVATPLVDPLADPLAATEEPDVPAAPEPDPEGVACAVPEEAA